MLFPPYTAPNAHLPSRRDAGTGVAGGARGAGVETNIEQLLPEGIFQHLYLIIPKGIPNPDKPEEKNLLPQRVTKEHKGTQRRAKLKNGFLRAPSCYLVSFVVNFLAFCTRI